MWLDVSMWSISVAIVRWNLDEKMPEKSTWVANQMCSLYPKRKKLDKNDHT